MSATAGHTMPYHQRPCHNTPCQSSVRILGREEGVCIFITHTACGVCTCLVFQRRSRSTLFSPSPLSLSISFPPSLSLYICPSPCSIVGNVCSSTQLIVTLGCCCRRTTETTEHDSFSFQLRDFMGSRFEKGPAMKCTSEIFKLHL